MLRGYTRGSITAITAITAITLASLGCRGSEPSERPLPGLDSTSSSDSSTSTAPAESSEGEVVDPALCVEGPHWRACELATARAALIDSGADELVLIDAPAVSATLRHLDHLQEVATLDYDRALVILGPQAVALVEDQSFGVALGDVVTVASGSSYSFNLETPASGSGPLELIEFVSYSPASTQTLSQRYRHTEQVALRDPAKRIWDPFVETPSMVVGMYMIPASIGGDVALDHGNDELTFIVAGQGTYIIEEDDALDVGPGTLVYIEASALHRFASLRSNLDALVFWDQ